MLHKFIIEIETPGSERGTFNRIDKLLGLYVGNCLPFESVSISYAPQETVEKKPELPVTAVD